MFQAMAVSHSYKGSGLRVIKGYEESESEFPTLMTIESGQITFF